LQHRRLRKVTALTGKITDALGFVIDLAIAEAELEAEPEAEEELVAEARLDSEPWPEARYVDSPQVAGGVTRTSCSEVSSAQDWWNGRRREAPCA
jgi:hypothetical protein